MIRWELVAMQAPQAWRHLLHTLAIAILCFACVLYLNNIASARWVAMAGLVYWSLGYLTLEYWPHAQWSKLTLIGSFILCLLLCFHWLAPISPVWLAPIVILYSLTFDVALIILSFVSLFLMASASWSQSWPTALYAWQYISFSVLMVSIAAHRNQWHQRLMPLLHFNLDQNLYYASYLPTYFEREIHRSEREGTQLTLVAMNFNHPSRGYPRQDFTRLFPKFRHHLRPFDEIFAHPKGLMLVLPYFDAQEAQKFCLTLLNILGIQATFGICCYQSGQTSEQCIEQAWQTTKINSDAITGTDDHDPS